MKDELTEEEKQAERDRIEEARLMNYQHFHVEDCECGE
jgi:hypothetical protein